MALNRIVSKKSLALDSEVWYTAYQAHSNWPVLHWFKLQNLDKGPIEKLWSTIQDFQIKLGPYSPNYTKELLNAAHIQTGWDTTNVKKWDSWADFFKSNTFEMSTKIALFQTFATETSFRNPQEYGIIEKVEKALGSSFLFSQLAKAAIKKNPDVNKYGHETFQTLGNIGTYDTYELLQELRKQKTPGWPTLTPPQLWLTLWVLSACPDQWKKDLSYESRMVLSQPAKYRPPVRDFSDWLDLNEKLGYDAAQLSPTWRPYGTPYEYMYLRLPASWENGSPQETYCRFLYLKKHVLDKAPVFEDSYHSLGNWIMRQTDAHKDIWSFEQRKTVFKDYIQALWTNTSPYSTRSWPNVHQICQMLYPELTEKLGDFKSTLEVLGYTELTEINTFSYSSSAKYDRKCVERDYELYAPIILEGAAAEINIDHSIFEHDYSE